MVSKKDHFHNTSRSYLTGLHALALSETHLLEKTTVIVPLSGVQPPLSPTILSKLDAIIAVFGNVPGTTSSFRRAMNAVRGTQLTVPRPQTPPETNAGRAAIADGYKYAHQYGLAVKYLTRLALFADELRTLVVSRSPSYLIRFR